MPDRAAGDRATTPYARRMRGFLVCCAVALPSIASADPLDGLRLEGWYGKLGVESGVAFGRDRGASPLLGGVATFVHINDRREWFGLQGDLLADGNGELSTGARWSIGPEAGVSIYGFDISYFGERLEGTSRHGAQARIKLTVGVAALYARAAYIPAVDAASFDIGMQLKAPVFIKRPRRVPPIVARR
jgi:hypothetical protein